MKAGIIWHPPDHACGVSLGVLRGTSRRSDEAQDHPDERREEDDGDVASQVLSIVRQKPTTVATPASSFPRSNANGINELVSTASSPPAASAGGPNGHPGRRAQLQRLDHQPGARACSWRTRNRARSRDQAPGYRSGPGKQYLHGSAARSGGRSGSRCRRHTAARPAGRRCPSTPSGPECDPRSRAAVRLHGGLVSARGYVTQAMAGATSVAMPSPVGIASRLAAGAGRWVMTSAATTAPLDPG